MPNRPTLGPCSCRRGIERDNCPQCEGTGQRVDFAAIRKATAHYRLQVGDRVTMTDYGVLKHGPITRIGPRSPLIIWVHFDGARTQRWVHAVSLTKANA